MGSRILLSASHSVIEPLGLLHLAGLARDLEWERKISLVRRNDFQQLFDTVKDFKPDVLGFSVYTGNHLGVFEAFKKIRADFPRVKLVLGGPHATYFPADAAQHADYVVMGEGFNSLRQILEGVHPPGIMHKHRQEDFPHPDRDAFYRDYPEFGKSRIKSVIATTGCPYSCTYCYNSSTPEDIIHGLDPRIAEELISTRGGFGKRLFPSNVRSVDDIIRECSELREKWPETKMLYFQDDAYALDVKEAGWMEQLAKRWKQEVGLPYHAQMRWEMTSSKKRLDLLQETGCFGLTLAIEAADETIRREVLNRPMNESIVFKGMAELVKRGLKVRTEQITGLPYGATSVRTPMNLEADLGLVELNVRLLRETGGPTMAWASTFAPYKCTKIGAYCEKHGHYNGKNNDVPDTFFDRSVLRFPKQWAGPSLAERKKDDSLWLSPDELEQYRSQNAELRGIFNLVSLIPEGHKLAEEYLKGGAYSFNVLGKQIESHLAARLKTDPMAARLLDSLSMFLQKTTLLTDNPSEQLTLKELAPFFACLPKSDLAAKRFLEYLRVPANTSQYALSTATRHHLYDNVLYSLD